MDSKTAPVKKIQLVSYPDVASSIASIASSSGATSVVSSVEDVMTVQGKSKRVVARIPPSGIMQKQRASEFNFSSFVRLSFVRSFVCSFVRSYFRSYFRVLSSEYYLPSIIFNITDHHHYHGSVTGLCK